MGPDRPRIAWRSNYGLLGLALAATLLTAGYGFFSFADQYRQPKALDSAIVALRLAVEKDPTDVSTRIRLATAYLDSGQTAAARAEFEEILKAKPDFVMPITGIGLTYYREGKYNEALEQFDNVIGKLKSVRYAQYTADLNNALYFSGLILLHKGNLQGAEERLRAAVVTNNADGDAHMYLGWVLCQLGKCEEGLAETSLAMQFGPDSAEPHYYNALVLDRLGRKNEAIKELNSALKLRPDWREATEALQKMTGRQRDQRLNAL